MGVYQSEYILSDPTQIEKSVRLTDELVVPDLRRRKNTRLPGVMAFSFGEEIKARKWNCFNLLY